MEFNELKDGMILISRDPIGDYKKEDLVLIRKVTAKKLVYNQLRCNNMKTRWVYYRSEGVCDKKDWKGRGTIFEDLDYLRLDEKREFIEMIMWIPESDTYSD